MPFGNLLKDIVTFHPGRALEDLPGGHFVEKTLGQTSQDFVNALVNAPGGLAYIATQGPRHPLRVGEQIAESTWQDIKHPLRHPGYTALDLVGLLPIPGAAVSRVSLIARAGERGALAARAGTTAEVLQQAVDEGILPAHLVSKEAALMEGKGFEFDRMVNPITGVPSQDFKSAGRQIKDAILLGAPREERLLYPLGIEDMDTPAGQAKHGWWYSRDPTIKAAQKLVNKAYDTLPESKVAPIWRIMTEKGPLRTQQSRMSSAEKAFRQGVTKEAKGRGPALLIKHAALMKPVNWMVLRLLGEGTDPLKLIEFHEKRLASGELKSERTIRETRARIATIKEAADYVQPKEITWTNPQTGEVVTRHVNELKPEHAAELQSFIDDFKSLSNERTHISQLAGVLSEADAYGRTAAPHALTETGFLPNTLSEMKHSLSQIEHDTRRTADAEKLREQIAQYEEHFNTDHVPDATVEKANKEYFHNLDDLMHFVNEGDLFRVPYALPDLKKLSKSDRAYRKTYKASAAPRVPGSFTHKFGAKILSFGGGEENVARLIAESYTEAHRFIALKSVWDRIQKTYQKTPEGIPVDQRQLVWLDLPGATKKGISSVERSLLTKKEDLGTKESIAAGRLFEGLRNFFFPDKNATAKDLGLSQEDFQRLMGEDGSFKSEAKDGTPYGWGWIDKRQLGDLYKKNPLVGLYDYSIARKALQFVDKVNQAVKSAMLFLRPAYAFPNIMGNIALNMIQQGMMSPFHMAENVRLLHKLPDEYLTMVDTQMGITAEQARYLADETLGGKVGKGIQRSSEALANFYSRFVDTPFRRNAWAQEARRAGYSTTEEVKRLLTDPELENERIAVSSTATDEIVNFERMGPGEEAVLRRLILFYPFTRGASRYTLNFAKEHPIATGMTSQLGKKGTERSEALLGPLPPWAEGLIPLEGLGIPFTHAGEVSNPAAFGIMGEPAHLWSQLMNIASGHPNPDLGLSQNLTPVDQAALSVLTGGSSSRFGAPGQPLLGTFRKEAFGGIPLISLYNSLMGRSALGGPLDSSAFPDPSIWHALNRFGFMGGMSPRLADAAVLNDRRYQEQPATYPS